METMWMFYLLLLIMIYLLPSIIAGNRQSVNATTIFWLNLVLWWTGIIWIVCLILAFWKTHKEVKRENEMLEALKNLKSN